MVCFIFAQEATMCTPISSPAAYSLDNLALALPPSTSITQGDQHANDDWLVEIVSLVAIVAAKIRSAHDADNR